MNGWDSIHQKFRDVENRINYDDLCSALRNTKPAVLLRLAAQLCIDESCFERDLKSLTTQQFQLTQYLTKTRDEYCRLKNCNQQIQTDLPELQQELRCLERKSSDFTATITDMQCQLSSKITTEKHTIQREYQDFACEKRRKLRKINDLFSQILLLRSGQLVQCNFFEDLVEKKPAILAKFKEQLKCKRKRLMQIQVHQEEVCVQDTCDKQRKDMLRDLERKLKKKEARDFNCEMEKIRQYKCVMDGLVRSYTEEMYKATELPVQVVHMKRFFQSLHRSGKSCLSVCVANNQQSFESWEKALEIQKMQKNLAYYYRQNFTMQSELTELLLDQQLLAVAIDADIQQVPPIDYAEVLDCHADSNVNLQSTCKGENDSLDCSVEQVGNHSGNHCHEKAGLNLGCEQPCAIKLPTVKCVPAASLKRNDSVGFMVPTEGENESNQMKLCCRYIKGQSGQRDRVSCHYLPTEPKTEHDTGSRRQTCVKIASFLKSEPDLQSRKNQISDAGCQSTPLNVKQPIYSQHRRHAVRVRPASRLPNICKPQTTPDTNLQRDKKGCDYNDKGITNLSDVFQNPDVPQPANISTPRIKESRRKSKVTYCECCDMAHSEVDPSCSCRNRSKNTSIQRRKSSSRRIKHAQEEPCLQGSDATPITKKELINLLTPGYDGTAESEYEYSVLNPANTYCSYIQTPDTQTERRSRLSPCGGGTESLIWRELAREILTTPVQVKYVKCLTPNSDEDEEIKSNKKY